MEFGIRKDSRPYWLKKISLRVNNFYVNHFIRPQFKNLGRGAVFFKPWFITLFGSNISVGDYATFISAPDGFIQLTSWDGGEWNGTIEIGSYVLVSPGVRMMAAEKISIGDACMFGHGACITDADWHGIYDRTKVVGDPKSVTLEQNVWIGENAMICKGVRIGENSIIGARSVVTKDVPPNTVYAGNPAAFIRNLDEGEFITRKDFFSDSAKLAKDFDLLDQFNLGKNSIWGWIKSIIWRDKTH